MSAGTARFPAREVRVLDALRAVGDARRLGGGRFGLLLDGSGVEGVLEGDWLRLDAEAPGMPGTQVARLEANAAMTGPAKWVHDPAADDPRLVADVWCADDGLAATVQAACDSLAAALGNDADSEHAESTGDVGDRLAAAGWTSNRRDDGSATVDLEAERDYYAADVRLVEGRLVSSVEVAGGDSFEPCAADALSRLLLGAGSTLRLARGAVAEVGAGRSYRFEVGLSAAATADELDRALRSLAVAVTYFGPEARALARAELATTYAAVRGWSPAAQQDRRARRGAKE